MKDITEEHIPFERNVQDWFVIPNQLMKLPRKNKEFSGITTTIFRGKKSKQAKIKGINHGISEALNREMSIGCLWFGEMNGYWFFKNKYGFVLMTMDMGEEIESIHWNEYGERTGMNTLSITSSHLDIDTFMSKYPKVIEHIDKVAHSQLWSSLIEVSYFDSGVEMELAQRLTWAYERKLRMQEGMYSENSDFLPYYIQQNEMCDRVIKIDELPVKINLIGGVDVAYNEIEQKMIGAVVVLNSETLEIVDEAHHEMNITFPYVPSLFSFREVPPIIEAFKKLKTKPEIIICDGHGIAHPKKIGIATHLGIELNLPTIGCAKNRLVGIWEKEKLGAKRGSIEPLNWDGEEVGKVLRTQDDVKPVFVSIGHKISLNSATSWVLKLCSQYRLPETTRKSDQIVNRLMKDRTEIRFMDREEE